MKLVLKSRKSRPSVPRQKEGGYTFSYWTGRAAKQKRRTSTSTYCRGGKAYCRVNSPGPGRSGKKEGKALLAKKEASFWEKF